MPRRKQPSKPPEVDNLDDAKCVIQALWDRLNDLEDRLKQNSRNSSRPPSSNGPGASSSAPAKKPTGRKRGAQSGHKGSKRMLADSVDETLSKPKIGIALMYNYLRSCSGQYYLTTTRRSSTHSLDY